MLLVHGAAGDIMRGCGAVHVRPNGAWQRARASLYPVLVVKLARSAPSVLYRTAAIGGVIVITSQRHSS